MGRSNVEVVTSAVEAMIAGKMEGLGGFLTEDVITHIPGSTQFSGVLKGRDAFFESFVGKIVALTEGRLTIQIHEVLGGTEHATGIYTVSATRGDKTFEWHQVNVYHVRGEQIAELWLNPHEFEAWNAFWS